MQRWLSAVVIVFTVGANLANADDARAWGAAAHRMIGGLAAQSLPAEIPAFLRSPEAARQIAEVAREPDRSRGAGQPHDPDADPAHHVDVGDDLKISRGPSLTALPPNRESYDTALRSVGTDEYRVGYLPYAIIDGWQQLALDLAYWRADVAGASHAKTPSDRSWFLRDQYVREGLTIRDIGYWSHFVADGAQPMNVSVHSDGWGSYPNPEKFSPAKGLRARFEGSFVRRWIGEKDISVHLTPYRDCRCAIQRRISDYLSATQRQVLTLYRIEKAGGFDGSQESGKDFAAARLAAATSELRDLIVGAWHRSDEMSVGDPPIALREIEAGRTDALTALQGSD